MPSGLSTGLPLDDALRVVGALISYALSLLLLILKKPPAPIPSHPLFSHTRAFSAAIIAVGVALTWLFLGQPDSAAYLGWIAAIATAVGFGCFFWVAIQVNLVGAANARPRTIQLFSYVCYSIFISWGLSAVAVLILVLALNPNNPASLSVARQKVFGLSIRVTGATSIQSQSVVPFQLSSGQVNFGCEQTQTAQVAFEVPVGGAFIGTPEARWINFSNGTEPSPPSVAVIGGRAVASGSIRGQNFQNFGLGIRNCPGGGHGELVISGNYRATQLQREQRDFSLTSSVAATAGSITDPVEVTLPTREELQVASVIVQVAEVGSSNQTVSTVELTRDRPESRDSATSLVFRLDAEANRLLVFADRRP